MMTPPTIEIRCFDGIFPSKMLVNLDRRSDRRERCQGMFGAEAIEVVRMSAIDSIHCSGWSGNAVSHHACKLSHRLVLRAARRRKVEAVLVFEDDVGVCSGFKEQVEGLSFPDDWGIIFFGCTHVKMPEVVSDGWVRVKAVWGTHCYAVRGSWIPFLLKKLREPTPEGLEPGIDNVISRLSGEIPMYAVYPNLAWQVPDFSDIMGTHRETFSETGEQLRFRSITREIERQMEEMRKS